MRLTTPSIPMTRNIDIVALLLPLAFGLLFLAESLGIPAGASDSIGPRRVPLVISISVIVLSLILVVQALRAPGAASADHITPRSLMLQAGPLILIAVLYGQMIVWFGYLLSTFVAGLLVFRLYANSIAVTVAHAAIGAIVFYLAFVKGMRIYDPPGTLIDISAFLIW